MLQLWYYGGEITRIVYVVLGGSFWAELLYRDAVRKGSQKPMLGELSIDSIMDRMAEVLP